MAVSGDHNRLVMLPAEAVDGARTVEAPTGAGNLPGSASGVFVGREQALVKVRAMLSDGGEAVVTQTGAVHGLGGVGKSTMALHYAHRFRAHYSLVWWITADSPESIVSGLAALAFRLCPQWAVAADVNERAAWATTWLGWHPGWLLIFDNVEDPAQLLPYTGTLTGGHQLATSRKATGWHNVAPAVPLDLLAPEAAADLLCVVAFGGRTPTDDERDQAEALARDLGFLPLALEQAGAHAYQTGTDLGSYREALGAMLGAAADGIRPERTIARIWDRTLAAIENRDPLAVTLLYTMAWLAPDDIPRTLLAPVSPDPIALGNALGVLHAYNMVAFTDQQGVSVHRLVQTVLRARHVPGSGAEFRGRHEAESAVRQAVPGEDDATDEDVGRWERLIPQVMALVESSPPEHLNSADTIAAYCVVARYLHRQGRDAHSVPLREAVLAHRAGVLGDSHPDTLTSRNHLANACLAAGNLTRATALYETTLTRRRHVLGDAHPDTLRSQSNLADAYWTAGDLTRAIPLHEATLTRSEQVLGNTHPDTLRSRDHLAGAYESAGDLTRAIHLFEIALAQRQKVLGDTHPDTLDSRINLAEAYQFAGDLSRATTLFETAMAERARILGDTHPATLRSRNYVARVYQAAGDMGRAIPLYEATLTLFEKVLGDTHPQTLHSRSCLANAYSAAEDPDRALPLHEATLTQRERILGHHHPDTLISRSDLAAAYQAAQARECSGVRPQAGSEAAEPDDGAA